MRFDVPVVGRKTIQVMQQSKATVLAVDAGKTIAVRPATPDRRCQ